MTTAAPHAVIDIGSNSIRLVVYSGPRRSPSIIFNEKVLVGLGRELADSGTLSAEAQVRAMAALARFQQLTRHMGVRRVRTVATAAVRDAGNGPEFAHSIEKLGLKCEILSAGQEAALAGEGVLSAIPDADGLAGDLGGGSLELVEVGSGSVGTGVSLPIGVLRVKSGRRGSEEISRAIREGLEQAGLHRRGKNRPFYMVGGSWRALARLDMTASGYPLPITHQYAMAPARARQLEQLVEALGAKGAKAVPAVAAERFPTLPAAAKLLSAVVETIKPSRLIVSSYGIREGLLYSGLPRSQRCIDPLISAARDASLAVRRFEEHGDRLDEWIAPIFDDAPQLERLRLASCILADAAWQAHPDFRAERGVELALHGNWVGIDAGGRVLLAQALYSNFGAPQLLPDEALRALCRPEAIERALHWGLAMRLGQRLCGGVASALGGTRLDSTPKRIRLRVDPRRSPLVGEAVERRLARLAEACGKRPEVVIG